MTGKGLRRLEIVTWTVGCYLLLCILFNPPVAYRERIVDRTVVPPVVLSQTVHHRAYPRADSFLPFPDPQGVFLIGGVTRGGGSPQLNYEWTTLGDLPRTALWFGGIVISAAVLIIVLRRHRRNCPDPSLRGFEVVVATNQPASSKPPSAPPPTTSKNTPAPNSSKASN
jgi:hypothetical protein